MADNNKSTIYYSFFSFFILYFINLFIETKALCNIYKSKFNINNIKKKWIAKITKHLKKIHKRYNYYKMDYIQNFAFIRKG